MEKPLKPALYQIIDESYTDYAAIDDEEWTLYEENIAM